MSRAPRVDAFLVANLSRSEDGTMVVTLDWSLANDAEARAYLQVRACRVSDRRVGPAAGASR